MKKFFFFVCAIAAAATMNARDNHQVADEMPSVMKEYPMKDLRIQTTRTANALVLTDAQAATDGPKKVVASFEDSQYYYTPGMMHAGVSPTGGLYYPVLNVPYQDSTVYYNWWSNEVEPAWYLTNSAHTQLKESSQTYTAYYGIGDYYLPEVGEGMQKSVTGDTTYVFKAYSYGEAYAARAYVASGAKEGIKPAMTLCNMWANTVIGSETQDFYSVGAGNAGKYAYGTNLTIQGYRLDTIAQLVRGVSPMKINALYLPIYGQSTDETIGSMLPNGAKVKVELFPIKNGRLFPAQPFATTYFSAADFTPAGSSTSVGVVKINFTEKDAQGVETVVPVFTPDSFGVMLTGFNEQACNFGIKSDYYCPKSNTTYYRNKGTWSTIWSGGGNNIALSFDAYWPFLDDKQYQNEVVPTVWEAPVAGGYAQYLLSDKTAQEAVALYTNTKFDNWEFFAMDADENVVDWVSVETDKQYYDDKDVVIVAFQTQPLPAGVDYREAKVGVTVDGISYSRIITQGEKKPAGIETIRKEAMAATEKVIRDGRVMIVKDQKVYNALGQMVK